MPGLGRKRLTIDNSNVGNGTGIVIRRVSPGQTLGLDRTVVYEPEPKVIKGIQQPGYQPPNIAGGTIDEEYEPNIQ